MRLLADVPVRLFLSSFSAPVGADMALKHPRAASFVDSVKTASTDHIAVGVTSSLRQVEG